MSFFVHESSYIDDNCEIGEGTKIWHFCHIQSGAKIGNNCSLGQNINIGHNAKIGNFVKIQNNVVVSEGVELEDYVFCGPMVVFTNVLIPRCKYPQRGAEYYLKTLVKEGATLGANCVIICGNTVGKNAFVAAGTIVNSDVPDYALIAGIPGRVIGFVSEAGVKLNFDENGLSYCEKSGKKYKYENGKVREV